MPFHHVGLSVGDLDASQDWYQRALGLETEFEFEIPGDIRGAMLRSSEGYRLELLEREGSSPGLSGTPPNEAMLTRGFGHFALQVTGLDEVFSRLVAEGGSAVWDPRPSPEPGVRMAFVHDPEGNLIELLEREA